MSLKGLENCPVICQISLTVNVLSLVLNSTHVALHYYKTNHNRNMTWISPAAGLESQLHFIVTTDMHGGFYFVCNEEAALLQGPNSPINLSDA